MIKKACLILYILFLLFYLVPVQQNDKYQINCEQMKDSANVVFESNSSGDIISKGIPSDVVSTQNSCFLKENDYQIIDPAIIGNAKDVQTGYLLGNNVDYLTVFKKEIGDNNSYCLDILEISNRGIISENHTYINFLDHLLLYDSSAGDIDADGKDEIVCFCQNETGEHNVYSIDFSDSTLYPALNCLVENITNPYLDFKVGDVEGDDCEEINILSYDMSRDQDNNSIAMPHIVTYTFSFGGSPVRNDIILNNTNNQFFTKLGVGQFLHLTKKSQLVLNNDNSSFIFDMNTRSGNTIPHPNFSEVQDVYIEQHKFTDTILLINSVAYFNTAVYNNQILKLKIDHNLTLVNVSVESLLFNNRIKKSLDFNGGILFFDDVVIAWVNVYLLCSWMHISVPDIEIGLYRLFFAAFGIEVRIVGYDIFAPIPSAGTVENWIQTVVDNEQCSVQCDIVIYFSGLLIPWKLEAGGETHYKRVINIDVDYDIIFISSLVKLLPSSTYAVITHETLHCFGLTGTGTPQFPITYAPGDLDNAYPDGSHCNDFLCIMYPQYTGLNQILCSQCTKLLTEYFFESYHSNHQPRGRYINLLYANPTLSVQNKPIYIVNYPAAPFASIHASFDNDLYPHQGVDYLTMHVYSKTGESTTWPGFLNSYSKDIMFFTHVNPAELIDEEKLSYAAEMSRDPWFYQISGYGFPTPFVSTGRFTAYCYHAPAILSSPIDIYFLDPVEQYPSSFTLSSIDRTYIATSDTSHSVNIQLNIGIGGWGHFALQASYTASSSYSIGMSGLYKEIVIPYTERDQEHTIMMTLTVTRCTVRSGSVANVPINVELLYWLLYDPPDFKGTQYYTPRVVNFTLQVENGVGPEFIPVLSAIGIASYMIFRKKQKALKKARKLVT